MPGDVVSMVLREGLGLAALGMLIGIPVVWLGSKYVEKELSRMKPLEPLSLALALGILMVAALVVLSIPALRAAALKPAETLRQE
jgi:ABC-type antimicrobial peptide transport system permease subunit